MAGPVLHIADQPAVRRAIGAQFVEYRAHGMDDFEIGLFVPAAYVVGFAHPPPCQHQTQRARMVVDKQPVADVVTLAVDGGFLAA